MATNELSIKLLIDTKAQKVCFAEAGNDVVEFLSCLLCLPLSTIIKLLTKENMVGSIGNVHDSIQELKPKYLFSSKGKEPYLSPTIAPPAVLHPLQHLLDVPLNVNTSFFTCEGKTNSKGYTCACGYISSIKGTICPSCFMGMNKTIQHARINMYEVGTATYTVKDDLSITPASSVSSVALLAQSGVKDLSTLREMTVKIGKEEARDIHLASLKSRTVLTDAFLQKKKVKCNCKKETDP